MEDNPYSAPEHYSHRPKRFVPFTAYIVAGATLVLGIGVAVIGFYLLMPMTALSGLFWACVGGTGVYYIVLYRREPNQLKGSDTNR